MDQELRGGGMRSTECPSHFFCCVCNIDAHMKANTQNVYNKGSKRKEVWEREGQTKQILMKREGHSVERTPPPRNS